MFLSVASFEFNFHRKQYLVYVLCGIFFLLAFLATATPNVSLIGGAENLNINSPWVISTSLTVLSIFSMFGAIAFASGAVLRDFEHKTAELFFSTGVSRFDYVIGRFAGALPFVFLLHFAAVFGVMAGEFMPWNDIERIGPFSLEPYWFASWALVLPNFFFFSALFFCVASLTRSMMATYVSAVVVLMLNFLMEGLTDKDTLKYINLLDPFGMTSWEEITRYWTVYEKNNFIPPLTGDLLYNRLIWLSMGVVALFVSYRFFPFSLENKRRSRSSEKEELETDTNIGANIGTNVESKSMNLTTLSVAPTQEFGFSAGLRQYASQAIIEIKSIVFSIPFVVVLALGLLLVVATGAASLGDIFGTSVYPTTGTMVQVINGSFSLSLLVVLIYYSGELMSRERNVKISEMMDAMPHSDWVMIAAKLSGSMVVVFSMLLIAMLAAMGVQIYLGYYEFNVLSYLQGLLLFFQFPLYFMCVLAVFFFLISRSKYLAMFLMVLYIIYMIAMPAMGFDHYLYLTVSPRPPQSDFTGYSHNLSAYLWFSLYWTLWGGFILLMARLIWPRGSEDRFATILKTARQRLSPGIIMSACVLLLSIFATGSWIFYNTNVLNQHVTEDDQEKLSAEYEKAYKQYLDHPQPSIQKVYAEVDIYPESNDVYTEGSYLLANNTDKALLDVHFSIPAQVALTKLSVANASIEKNDLDLNYRIYKFDRPLAPGETVKVEFTSQWLTPGFKNRPDSFKVVSNGTFFNNMDVFPQIGYQKGLELVDNSKRRKYGLPKAERMKKITDTEALMSAGLGSGARVEFETIVSTSSEQIAIAPGYLQKEWQEGERKFFHYKMDAPIWNFFSYLSADYKVKKEVWNGISIEVYYHHEYNVDRMIEATKKSLAYFNSNFSPYQYRQFRILEFPRYQGAFAQSFPNTVPFSERIGFMADLRDKSEIDYVFYVTAHELAHQWWAHQVLGADVQGSTMIVESLAQYSALMVMEKEYGKETMQRFLKYEMDRYLRDRGGEIIEELPMYLVENQQYVHYRKGSVNLYALQDYLGSDVVNGALREFINDYAFKDPPYPTSLDLIEKFRAVAGNEYQSLITDLFEKIVLYDLKVTGSKLVTLESGQFEVSIDIAAHKFEADGAGKETEVPLRAFIDIGVLGEDQGEEKLPEVIYLEKHEVTENMKTITIIVDKKPKSVGIDPFNKLIDRNPEDNVKRVGS